MGNSKVAYKLSKKVPTQIDQGKNVVTMSTEVMGATEPLITALNTANTDLVAKQAAMMEAEVTLKQAFADLRASAGGQRIAYNNLGGLVQTNSNGDPSYILGCGYGLRAAGAPIPPVQDAPINLRTRVNGVPGQVLFSWGSTAGARNYEPQYTTDLSGATGWTSVDQMPGAVKYAFEGLTSGTKYAFRVRAWGNGAPGPWSSPIQQMAP